MSQTGPSEIVSGSVDQSVIVRIIDSADGTPELGVTAATGGLVLNYRRSLSANVSLATITDLAALTTAHTDKGILHIGNGYYRVDVPDAAWAVGAADVLVHGVATGMVVIGTHIQLVPQTVLSGQFSGTHSTTTADLGTLAPANDISGQTLYFPTVKQARVVASYNTGTGVATFAAIQAAPNDNEGWVLYPTGPLDATTLAAIVAALPTIAAVADLPTNAELATALGTADDAMLTQIALIKSQTDKFVFTVANQVDANLLSWNGTATNGDGSVGDKARVGA